MDIEDESFADDPEIRKRVDWFVEYWIKEGVNLIGFWRSLDNPARILYMTAYRNQEHYENFITRSLENEEYQKRSAKRIGKMARVETMVMDRNSSLSIDIVDYSEYIKDVKKIIESESLNK